MESGKAMKILLLLTIITATSFFLTGCAEQGANTLETVEQSENRGLLEAPDKGPATDYGYNAGPTNDKHGMKEMEETPPYQDPAVNDDHTGFSDEHAELMEKAEKHGRIPIIVHLRIHDTPPGIEVSDEDKGKIIVRTQEQVINRLLESRADSGEDLSIKTFMVTPAFAMQAGKEEIKELITYPEVEYLSEDTLDAPGG